MIYDLVKLKRWIEEELENGNRSKASRLNKIFEKHYNRLSDIEMIYFLRDYYR